jgi:hypothetical protein
MTQQATLTRSTKEVIAENSKGSEIVFQKSGKGFRSQFGRWVSTSTLKSNYTIKRTY